MTKASEGILFGIIIALVGCAESSANKIPGGKKGKKMDKLENITDSFQDLYVDPTSQRITELEMKLAEMRWDGIFIGAPDTLDFDSPGIPILAITGNTTLRSWEVEPEKNSALILSYLDRGFSETRPLYKRPEKKMIPQPKDPKPGPEAAKGREYGCERLMIGESFPEGIPSGEYAITLISWNWISNRGNVRKKSKPGTLPASYTRTDWPWSLWSDSQAFKASPRSPKVDGKHGLALKLDGPNSDILGSFSISARPIHIIPVEAIGNRDAGIQAGVNVDFLLFTLDRPSPEQIRFEVPVYSHSPIGIGNTIQGWFSIPFPFESSEEERMLYAVANGEVVGPFRIPGDKR